MERIQSQFQLIVCLCNYKLSEKLCRLVQTHYRKHYYNFFPKNSLLAFVASHVAFDYWIKWIWLMRLVSQNCLIVACISPLLGKSALLQRAIAAQIKVQLSVPWLPPSCRLPIHRKTQVPQHAYILKSRAKAYMQTSRNFLQATQLTNVCHCHFRVLAHVTVSTPCRWASHIQWRFLQGNSQKACSLSLTQFNPLGLVWYVLNILVLALLPLAPGV